MAAYQHLVVDFNKFNAWAWALELKLTFWYFEDQITKNDFVFVTKHSFFFLKDRYDKTLTTQSKIDFELDKQQKFFFKFPKAILVCRWQ